MLKFTTIKKKIYSNKILNVMSSLSVSLQLQFVTSLCLQDEIICEMDASHQTLDR